MDKPTDKSGLRILYIEDEKNQRESLTEQLTTLGHSVSARESGKQALECLADVNPEIILCDLNMPEMSGIEVLQSLRDQDIDVPFILMTAHGSVELAKQAVQKGVYHFLIKPFNVELIEILMYQALEHARLQSEFKKTESSLQDITNNVDDIIYSVTPEGIFTSINPAFERILGYKVSEKLSTSMFDIIHQDEREERKNTFLQDVKDKKINTVVINSKLVSKSGDVRHIEVSRKMVVSDGQVTRCDGIARDISEEVLLREGLNKRTRQLEDKAHQLENSSIELAKANVDLLTARESLEQKQSERERILEELTKSREELQAILDASPSVIIMSNRYGKIGAVNSRVENYFGIKRENVIGKQFQQFGQLILDCFEEKSKYAKTMQNIWKDPDAILPEPELGKHSFETALKVERPVSRFITIDSRLVKNDNGDELGRVWIFDDITALKRADEQLHTLIEASPIPMIISRISDGKIQFVNDALGNVLKYEAKSVLGKSTLEFYENPEDRQKVLASLKEHGHVSNFEVRIKRGDGTVAWTMFSIGTTELNGEQMIVGGLYDISDRKEAEQALSISEQRFRGLVENANDIIFSLDANGTLKYISPQITKLLGWTPDEFLGKSVLELIIPEDAPITKEWIDSGFKGANWSIADGFRLKHKEGNWRWFTSDAAVIRREDGSPEEVIGIAHDITEMRNLLLSLEKTNKELKATQSQLLQSEKMAALGLLVAGIAHEINTPIGAVISMHDTLVRGLEKLKITLNAVSLEQSTSDSLLKIFEAIDDSNKVMKSGTARVSEIVRRLRSFARLDEAELKTVDIHDGLEDTLTLVHHELKHNIEVVRNFGEIDPIACYPGQLNQVFLNLIVNAKQAIKGNGTITITTGSEGDKVFVKISDTGVGIPKASLAKIFDPGFTTKGVGVGTGLGLSICYQIIQTHRGEIKVDSEIGQGTTFTIVLPKDLDKIIEN